MARLLCFATRFGKSNCALFQKRCVPQDCVYPPEYEGHLESLMIKRDMILARVRDLAQSIHKDYQGRRPVILCVLKGANPVRFLDTACIDVI